VHIYTTQPLRWGRAEMMKLAFGLFGISAITAMLALTDASQASDYRYINPQLLLIHDFADIVVPKDKASSVRAFINNGELSANSVPKAELDQIRSVAVSLLGERVSLASEQNDATLLVQIRAYKSMNYAIRNGNHEPAHGLILVGFCRLPVSDIKTDCENMNYYYFSDLEPLDLFQDVFTRSINAVLPASASRT
jgi:hypothetical protein